MNEIHDFHGTQMTDEIDIFWHIMQVASNFGTVPPKSSGYVSKKWLMGLERQRTINKTKTKKFLNYGISKQNDTNNPK